MSDFPFPYDDPEDYGRPDDEVQLKSPLITFVHFAGKRWRRFEPPWLKGRRPTVTYTPTERPNYRDRDLEDEIPF